MCLHVRQKACECVIGLQILKTHAKNRESGGSDILVQLNSLRGDVVKLCDFQLRNFLRYSCVNSLKFRLNYAAFAPAFG